LRILIFFLLIINLYGSDLTIEVKKEVGTLPSLALEDSSNDFDLTFQMGFFKALYADMNVISLFNVDRHRILIDFDASDVGVEHKDFSYTLRYKLINLDGMLGVDMKLFQNHQVVLSKKYKIANKNSYIFLAHTIAYDINKFLGAKDISWIKRKVIFAKVTAPKQSEIVIADYTLTYQHAIISGGFNIFPKWANQEQTAIYYTSFNEKTPTLKYLDFKTGRVSTIATSEGMIVCSDVSADGNKILITMAPKGQPDIYLYQVDSKKFQRITTYPGIDVNGNFLEGGQIVFVSDRLGYPNIFTKKIGESSVEQLVYYGKTNAACSAHGKYVVYKARESSNLFSKNTFNLHLVSLESDFIRRLTATGVNEFPRFSRDGNAILFIKNYKQQSAIGIIKLDSNKNYLFPIKNGRIQSLDW